MLDLIIPSGEEWNEKEEMFYYSKPTTIKLEHSLASVSKWESKYHKAFISDVDKSEEELACYIKMMVISRKPSNEVYVKLFSDKSLLKKIQDYIDDPMSATTFLENDNSNNPQRYQKITSELIYYYMSHFNIPFECQYWHLNRLLTLIKICVIKENQSNGKSGGKMSEAALHKQYSSLNEQRRKAGNTRG